VDAADAAQEPTDGAQHATESATDQVKKRRRTHYETPFVECW
jgi:hypothetical protein